MACGSSQPHRLLGHLLRLWAPLAARVLGPPHAPLPEAMPGDSSRKHTGPLDCDEFEMTQTLSALFF